jgi:glyoxylase-like metal-dependent hydrolase (beta-lactamase superfamily II)
VVSPHGLKPCASPQSPSEPPTDVCPQARGPQADWLRSLNDFAALPATATVVPSHGPVHSDGRGLAQTREYLRWLDRQFSDWAAQGLEMNEVIRAPVPEAFRRLAAFDTEYLRNVAHLYPRYEQRSLAARAPAPAPVGAPVGASR